MPWLEARRERAARSSDRLLVVDQVDVFYGAVHALHGISLVVREGELVCLLGGNASGKSTTMKTILGLVKPRAGTVSFRGERIDGLKTSQIVRRGSRRCRKRGGSSRG